MLSCLISQSRRLPAADYRKPEQLGAARVQSALAGHSAKVAGFFVGFPAILANAVVVSGCLLYLALLSWQIFLAAVVLAGLGTCCCHWAQLRAIGRPDAAAAEQDAWFGHFRALTAVAPASQQAA